MKRRNVDIFGTSFCVPKGHVVGEGFVIECKIPSHVPRHRVKELIRDDIERLYQELGDDFTEQEFSEWLRQ